MRCGVVGISLDDLLKQRAALLVMFAVKALNGQVQQGLRVGH